MKNINSVALNLKLHGMNCNRKIREEKTKLPRINIIQQIILQKNFDDIPRFLFCHHTVVYGEMTTYTVPLYI